MLFLYINQQPILGNSCLMGLKSALDSKLYFERSKIEPNLNFGKMLDVFSFWRKNFFWITVVPHTFLVPLLVKHNKNLKCEITEQWFVFVYSKCDFWASHTQKHTCTKFQLDRSFRPEVIKENVNSKWQILLQIRYFAQIFK